MLSYPENTRHKTPFSQNSELQRDASVNEAFLGLLEVGDGSDGIDVLLKEGELVYAYQ